MPVVSDCPFNQFRHQLARLSRLDTPHLENHPESRELIHKIIEMIQHHDPQETGRHVKRVAAGSAELYRLWAGDRGLDSNDIRKTSSALQTAALFHDIGKTALNCMVLKSSRTLRETEYNLIKYHTIFGASLFRESPADWGPMAGDICLNHHEKWNGTGYPGRLLPDPRHRTQRWIGKRGHQIPLTARIVALIDVYDALSARRSYKTSWPDHQIKRYFREQSGRHFEPRLVDIFLHHYEVFRNLRDESG